MYFRIKDCLKDNMYDKCVIDIIMCNKDMRSI